MKLSMLLAFASVSLSACQQSNSNICGSLPMKFPNAVVATADDQKQVLYSCMERWAARLSHSNDAAPYVARAAVAACDEARLYYMQRLMTENLPQDRETTSSFWLERTLFIAVQTRAGNCYKYA